MDPRRLVFLHTPEVEQLSYPASCPLETERAQIARKRLISLGLLGGPGQEEAPFRKATLAELRHIHSEEYLAELRRAAAGDLTVEGFHMGIGGPDTPVFADMFECGAWACGAALAGCDILTKNKADIVFNFHGGFHPSQRLVLSKAIP